jgi:hypothetical protein
MGGGAEFWRIFSEDPRSCQLVECHEQLCTLMWQKRIAIDNSINICRDTVALRGRVAKPHLRNTFFRLVRLLSANLCAFPIVVIDGEPPEAKNATRMSFSFPDELPSMETKSSVARNAEFCRMSSECATLATLLGCPVIHAKAEAEVACAKLNLHGYCDACVTTDGDALALGVTTLYKRFDLITPSVEVYSSQQIQDAGLGHNAIISCLLLCGSDFHAGVKGVSTVTAKRFARTFGSQALAQLQRWGDCGQTVPMTTPDGEALLEPIGRKPAHCCCSEPPAGACGWCRRSERWAEWRWVHRLRARCICAPGFPWPQLSTYFASALILAVDEKKHYDDRVVWSTPNTTELVNFLELHLDWPPGYTLAHVMPVVARFYWFRLGERPIDQDEFRPQAITRTYRHQGQSVFDVKCYTPNTATGESVVSVRAEVLERCDPTLVSQFRMQQATVKATKRTKKRSRSPEGVIGNAKPSRFHQSKLTEFMKTVKPSVSPSVSALSSLGSSPSERVAARGSGSNETRLCSKAVWSGSTKPLQLAGASRTFVDLTVSDASD